MDYFFIFQHPLQNFPLPLPDSPFLCVPPPARLLLLSSLIKPSLWAPEGSLRNPPECWCHSLFLRRIWALNNEHSLGVLCSLCQGASSRFPIIHTGEPRPCAGTQEGGFFPPQGRHLPRAAPFADLPYPALRNPERSSLCASPSMSAPWQDIWFSHTMGLAM